MKILVVGGGGREHAICWKLSQSPLIGEGNLHCAPGNGGISQLAICHDVKAEDIEGQVSLAKELNIDLVVIGPEVPLAMGIVDRMEAEGIKTFGPDKNCAQLEASKAFTKAFLARHKIPTAGYKEYTDKELLLSDIGIYGFPMVIKADGLASGKGVIIAENHEEARLAIEDMMGNMSFGDAGKKIVVEEFLKGIEASCLCFVDENNIIPMESAQDYKRIGDGDKGLNTGGMGTYSPSLLMNNEMTKEIREKILEPTLKGFQKDGLKFRGVLFIGLMLGEDGPRVIEFNNRFGDPETQSVLMRLESDLLEIFLAVCDNRLGDIDIKWKKECAQCVIMAAGGYPGKYNSGDLISGIDEAEAIDGVKVFHSGTTIKDGELYTSGGRVLGVAAISTSHEDAKKLAYKAVSKINFENAYCRKDIGDIIIK